MSNKWYNKETNKRGYVSGYASKEEEIGVYYRNTKYNAVVPDTIDSSTHVVLCSCNPHDLDAFSDYIRDNACENTVYIIIGSIQDNSYASQYAQDYAGLINEIVTENNIPDENVGVITWSNGNKGGSYVAESLHDDYGIEVGTYANVMGNLDGAGVNGYNETLRNSDGTTYLYFDDGHNNYGQGGYYNNFNKGNNYIELVFEAGSGNGHNFYKMNDQYDIIGYISGARDLKTSEGNSFKLKAINIYENGELVRTVTDPEEMDKILNDQMDSLLEREYNIESYRKENNKHEVKTTKDMKVSDKYSDLKDIESLHINFTDVLGGDVRSDLEYVESQVNDIRSKIKQSGFLQGVSNQEYRSGSEIPGCINDYIIRYYDVIGNLIDLLEQQTEAIISFGQAYVDMDQDLQKRQDELNAQTYTGGLVEEEYIPRKRKSLVSETPSQEVNPSPTPEKTSSPSGSKRSGSGTSGGSSGYYGGGSPASPTETPKEDNLDLIEMERSDGSKVTAVMDGDKIKELKYVYEYKTKEEAEKNLEEIKEKYKETEFIEEVKVNENKVEAIFKEESYKDMTLEQVMEKYFVDIDPTKDNKTPATQVIESKDDKKEKSN